MTYEGQHHESVKSPRDARRVAKLQERRAAAKADLKAAQVKSAAGHIGEGIRCNAIRNYIAWLDEEIETAKYFARTGRG